MGEETNEQRVERLIREYARLAPNAPRPTGSTLLRDQLGIESLSLVSLLVRMADELGVDLLESGIELGQTQTVADLVDVAEKLSRAG